jgi:ABC-type phosphate transport system substrate-binding protein
MFTPAPGRYASIADRGLAEWLRGEIKGEPMFGFRKPGRAALRAALLAGAAVAAIGAGGAGTAAASPCEGESIEGQGSSLQKIAQQEVWTPAFNSSCVGKFGEPTVTYQTSSSGAGLAAWNADGVRGNINSNFAYIGTDDAPNSGQIGNINGVAGGGQVLIIPVAQTAISIMVNPPANCDLPSVVNIAEVERAFRGNADFTALTGNSTVGSACDAPINRVVRSEGSGTTFQFKHALAEANGAALEECSDGFTWEEIMPIGAGGTPNTTWPCEGSNLTKVAKGSGVAAKVAAEKGTIGYAALPDAKAAKAPVIALENPETTEPELPEEGTDANCEESQYTVPTEARTSGTGLSANWSEVFPEGGTTYPICTLTYDLAFAGYEAAGFTAGEATTVEDYLQGYVLGAGQGALSTAKSFYSGVPNVGGEATNVLDAAQYAASLISP